MGDQWASGNENIQIRDVSGSSIEITYGGKRRKVPLEPAVVPVAESVVSPARLLRARAGVVPFAVRLSLLASIEKWVANPEPFAGCVIGGRGGAGKTRLGVEICESARRNGWLAGLLTRSAEQAAVEELVGVPSPRLVVVDYAESRAEQLEVVLPVLAAGASVEHPVRVLLLVRAAPRRSRDWAEALRRRGDILDAVLDCMDLRVLDDEPLSPDERETLFRAAARAFAARAERLMAQPSSSGLGLAMFASPLLVVVAAYLAVHGEPGDLPSTRTGLLDGLTAHEDRYWAATATASGLDIDEALRQRVVALASLSGADSEAEAVGLLRLVPDLAGEGSQLLGRLARWAHSLYPGPRWWNPVEPDLLGEYIVADCLGADQGVLAGVLERQDPASVVQPLDMYARAAADYPRLAATLGPVLSSALESLCAMAVAQVADATDLELLLGGKALAGAVNRAVTVVPIDADVLPGAMDSLPTVPDVILSPLAVTITAQLVASHRGLAANPVFESALALAHNNLSIHLGEVGRGDESLAAIEEAAAAYRRLAAASPTAYEADLAMSLNNLSIRLSDVGRHDQALAAIEEAAAAYRRLAAASPTAYESFLVVSLNSLSCRLAAVGRREEALAASEEALAVCDRLAADSPTTTYDATTYDATLARTLNTTSVRLGEVGRGHEALAASEKALVMYRQLAAASPATYEADLARCLIGLSIHLGDVGRGDEALAAIEEAAAKFRRLAAASPAAYKSDLAILLNDLSIQLDEAGRHDDATQARVEAETLGSTSEEIAPEVFL
jgi:tetratricopeptide (TPR) repeat protein